MTPGTHSAVAMFTDFFASDDIAAAARRTGFVTRASKLTGTLFLALVTCGAWSDATPTLAQLAAQVPPWAGQGEGSPEAIQPRLNPRARAFLQALLHQALATVQAREKVCEDGRLTSFATVSLADSTGFELPERRPDLLPGSGGSAAKAGAKSQAVWDYKSSVWGHCVLPPGHRPDQKYVDPGLAWAQKGALFLLALGYLTIHALARLALAGADFWTRRNPQTTLFPLRAGGLHHVALPQRLQGVEGNRSERAIFIGAKELVPARLVAVRRPEPLVHARRRVAQKKAKKKGSRPSQAPLNLWAWHRCIRHVPALLWKTTTVGTGYPLRWQSELLLKSWTSALPGASIPTQKAATTWGSLSGRMLRIVLHDALCPPIRHPLWLKHKRERRVRTLVRHFQALADRWMYAILQSEFVLRRFRQRACATAERLVGKAARKRQTTAQILRESLRQQHGVMEFVAAVNA